MFAVAVTGLLRQGGLCACLDGAALREVGVAAGVEHDLRLVVALRREGQLLAVVVVVAYGMATALGQACADQRPVFAQRYGCFPLVAGNPLFFFCFELVRLFGAGTRLLFAGGRA